MRQALCYSHGAVLNELKSAAVARHSALANLKKLTLKLLSVFTI